MVPEDDIFAWRRRLLEESMIPTGFEGLTADDLLTRVTDTKETA